MTERERSALQRYIRKLADLMGLRDWTIELLTDPCSEDACATCDPTYGRRLAQIAVCVDFRGHDTETQRHTIVHELLHCVFALEQDHIRMHLPRHLSQSTYDVFNDTYRHMHEYAVDGLADVLALHMPIIDWANG